LAGVLLGIVLALAKSYLGRMKNSKEGNTRLQSLKQSWAFKTRSTR
jgi:hypothetical protein